MKHSFRWVGAVTTLCILAACGGPAPTQPAQTETESAGVINLYSARHYDSDKALYAAFEAETGIRVRAREAGAAQLLETMKAEGAASPADVIIAADAGTLWRFKSAGLTQPIGSELIAASIPSTLRDSDDHWTGLAKRYRVIAYDTDAVSSDEVDQMADLATPRFSGEICVRTSSNIYNLSLLGELVARDGESGAQEWAEGIVANFARDPSGGDTAQIRAIAAGACTVAIVNHYYWVRLATSGSADDRAVADSVNLAFADAGNGAHVNVTAGALAATAPNRENAVAFLEFLASPTGQAMLVSETKEFPVAEGVPLPDGLDLLTPAADSDIGLSALGENQATAQIIFDRAGWP